MKRLLLFPFLVIALILNVEAQSVNYRLVFQDDFEGTSLDTTVWSKIPRGHSDWDRHMSNNLSLYNVDNGILKLYARLNNGIVPNPSWIDVEWVKMYELVD